MSPRKEMYRKELAHMIMQAESQDLRLNTQDGRRQVPDQEGWSGSRPRRANVPAQVLRRPKKLFKILDTKDRK